MQTKERFYNGRKLVYSAGGNGPLVVLLHGFGETGTVWRNQFALFPKHRLLVPDLPGTGDSESIDDTRMEGLADAVKAIVDEETTGKIVLIGHSMGGYVALAFAEKYPDTVAALGLFHSTAFADSDEKKATRRKGIDAIRQKGAYAFLETVVPNLYGPASKEKNPERVAEHLATVRNATAETLVSYYEAMIARPDRTAVLQSSEVPVLFVMGKHDAAVPLEEGLKQCHLPRLSYIHLLENSGHTGMIEEVDETNQLLAAFLAAVENTA